MMSFVLDSENRINDDDEDEEHVPSDRCCVDCKACAPKTQTAHTLISSKHGWRLSRARASDGYTFQWRCPKCWAVHKTRGPDSQRY
jgi:hypothetical protein